jgi:two-component system, NtrC family, sensor kinase
LRQPVVRSIFEFELNGFFSRAANHRLSVETPAKLNAGLPASKGLDVLLRRSIRTKLTIVLSLMIAVVFVLGLSTFWGLYRYRSLANGIKPLASEIPRANMLSQAAKGMRDANHQIQLLRAAELGRLRDEEHLIAPHTLFNDSQTNLESNGFEMSLQDFERSLEEYDQLVSQSDAEAPNLFVDPAQRKNILIDIRRELARVKKAYRRASSSEPLKASLDLLADRSSELTSLMQQGMEAYSKDVRNQYRTGIAIVWSCLVAAIAMFVLLLLLFRSLVIKPFRTLLDGSRLVAAGQFQHKITLGTGDELSELAEVMNQMTARFRRTCDVLESERADLDQQVRDRSREVIQREQLASVGFLAAGVAHEINNPLASIAWSAEALESRLQNVIHGVGDSRTIAADEAKVLGENLRRIEDEAYRCKGITQRLLDFSRLGDVERTQVDIGELIRDVVAMVGTLGKYQCKTLRTHCEGAITAHVNGQQIRQVVLNLITNALESVDVDGAVDVFVAHNKEMVTVTVEDNGCGMTEEVLEHLFEPFFTRRRDGSGTGLGLSITHRIVTQHGGKLTASSDGPGRGSKLQFEVPAEDTSNADLQLIGRRYKEELYEPLRVA